MTAPQDPLCPYPPGTSQYPPGANKNRYSPVLTGNGLSAKSGIQDMPLTDITVVQGTTVSFQYPYIGSNTTTLTLRNPELNDIRVFQAYRVQDYSRGDTLIVYRDPQWFKTRVLNWSFTGLTRQNRIDILAFVAMSAGQYILVTDYWGVQFKAIIINPDNPITQETPDYQAYQIGSNTPYYPPTIISGGTATTISGSGYTWKVDLQKALK